MSSQANFFFFFFGGGGRIVILFLPISFKKNRLIETVLLTTKSICLG